MKLNRQMQKYALKKQEKTQRHTKGNIWTGNNMCENRLKIATDHKLNRISNMPELPKTQTEEQFLNYGTY